LPKTNQAKNCQKRTRQKIAENKPGKKLPKKDPAKNCQKRTRQKIGKNEPDKKLPKIKLENGRMLKK